MPQPNKGMRPKLVNRGGAGLYGKLSNEQKKGIIGTDTGYKELAWVVMNCGHEVLLSKYSSVFDHPRDGTYCPTCKQVKSVKIPVSTRPAEPGDSFTAPKDTKSSNKPVLSTPRAKYQIAPELQRFAVPIDSIEYDPDNARLHPDGNVLAIKESLLTYGQVVPLVVQKSTNKVVAGNGRLRCARELGWKKIAVHLVDMSDAEAAGYGLADNKTAELAKWDFETDVLKRIYDKVEKAGLAMTGWKEHELVVLRMADWIPPAQTTEDFQDGLGNVTIKCTGSEYSKIDEAMNEMHNLLVVEGTIKDGKDLSDAEYLIYICREWMERKFGHPDFDERNADRSGGPEEAYP